VEQDSFGKEISDVKELASAADHNNGHIEAKAYECMITCHSIAQVSNQFIGDPLDIEMFKATKWRIDEVENSKESDIVELARFEPELNEEEIARYDGTKIDNSEIEMGKIGSNEPASFSLVKRFDFSSSLQRMSVLSLNTQNKTLNAFVKGSPEMIYSLSKQASIPNDFFDVLEKYTKDGLRVLAFGYKEISQFDAGWVTECKREQIECDLTFIGFMVMENKVKSETIPSIKKLQAAEIDTIMATGDNGLTAVAVGRNCNIINPSRTCFLAERVKDHNHKFDIKWIRIDKNESLEDYLKEHEAHPHSISDIRERARSVHRLSSIDGYENPTQENNDEADEDILEKAPWEQNGNTAVIKNYDIAITGNAFELMMKTIKLKYTHEEIRESYKEVIAQAKVYARMSPDHKAMLVCHLQEHSKYMISM